MSKHTMVLDAPTTWLKWECDHGRRWTLVEGPFGDAEDHGRRCQFSGCEGGHFARIVGRTTDRKEACAWFRRDVVTP